MPSLEFGFFLLAYSAVIGLGVKTFFQLRKMPDHVPGSEALLVLSFVLCALNIVTYALDANAVHHFISQIEQVTAQVVYFGNKWFRLLIVIFGLAFLRRVNGLQTPFFNIKRG